MRQDVTYCENKAKRPFYWPNMTTDIKNYAKIPKNFLKYENFHSIKAIIPYNN